jgi:hypothetical protein
MFRSVAMLLVLALLPTAASALTLRRTDGTAVPLPVGGRPAILFYEDRHSHEWNQPLKDALFARGRARGLLDRVRVIPVANVAAFDFFPAREIATRYIRRLEEQVGVPILLDLDGTLARPPLSLPSDGAAVVVFDAHGAPILEHRGRLSQEDVDATLGTLERLLAEDAP